MYLNLYVYKAINGENMGSNECGICDFFLKSLDGISLHNIEYQSYTNLKEVKSSWY